MKNRVWVYLFLFASAFLSGCVLIEPDGPVPTQTPDSCTGWDCAISGVIYTDEAKPENQLAGISVTLKQISHCSPTAGEYQTVTGKDGAFSFDVFLHDTDSFLITVDTPGYQPAAKKVGGFDCVFCHCPPIEILLMKTGQD